MIILIRIVIRHIDVDVHAHDITCSIIGMDVRKGGNTSETSRKFPKLANISISSSTEVVDGMWQVFE